MNISGSSEKILEFLVNDILDFAPFRAGKFRKNFQNFFYNFVLRNPELLKTNDIFELPIFKIGEGRAS